MGQRAGICELFQPGRNFPLEPEYRLACHADTRNKSQWRIRTIDPDRLIQGDRTLSIISGAGHFVTNEVAETRHGSMSALGQLGDLRVIGRSRPKR
jgi:hypothetical protein